MTACPEKDILLGSDCEEEVASSPEPASPTKGSGKPDQGLFSGLEEQLNGLAIDPAAFVRALPPPVKRRLKALKKLQFQHVQLEANFYQEVHDLEARFATKYAALYDRRCHIVTGEAEPTDSDCDWHSEDEEEEEAAAGGGAGDTKQQSGLDSADSIKGMPRFWLTALKNVEELVGLIQEHDEPILETLTDIRCELSPPGVQPMAFSLHFHFAQPNPFFTNPVLTKKYNMKLQPDDHDIMYEGPEVVSCQGCTIDWKPGKNVTVKTIKKKQKHKKSGVHRTVQKQVQNESFFNFFTPPVPVEEQAEPATEELEHQLQSDFELAHFFREQIIPRAVLYYTGDAVEEDSEDEELDDDELDDEDEDDDDDELEHAASGLPNGGEPQGEKPECKQQ